MLRDDHAMWHGVERDVSKLPAGVGIHLWNYWTKGKGLAKWAESPKKWTTLHALLSEYVPHHMLDGLTTNIIDHVFPGYMKAHHHKGGNGIGDGHKG